MGQPKILSRDTESCQQLQLPAQFPRINVFNQNPNSLHNGNQGEEFKYINEYPPDQKSNPPRTNTFGTWRSFKKIKEIKDDSGKNIVGYKQEYDFKDNQGNEIGLKMREYTRYKRGENDNSYCVIYKKKKYDYFSTSEEWGTDMERQPNEEHRSSLAPTPSQAQSPTVAQRRESTTPSASQITDLKSAALNASAEKILCDLAEKILMTEDPETKLIQIPTLDFVRFVRSYRWNFDRKR